MSRRLTPSWRLRATLAALAFPPLVHLVSLERLTRWIDRSRRPSPPDGTVDDESLAEWVDRVLRRLPPPWRRTCLKRALVLHYLLHRAGRHAELRIGVRRDGTNALAAHAWLVLLGEPYLETGADHIDSYQVLATFPSPDGPDT
jgi:hypothetical protein